MARSAFITGWAHSPFGKLEDPDTEALMARVVRPALDHAQIAPEDVDGIFVGVMNNGFQKQDFQGALPALSEPALASKPAVRLEDACATGSAAIYAALNYLEAGQGKVALVVG
ncbi:MAG: thiolase domain-containing protein, partial [Rhodomicrobium sp.]